MEENFKDALKKSNTPGSKEHILATFMTAGILLVASAIFGIIELISR